MGKHRLSDSRCASDARVRVVLVLFASGDTLEVGRAERAGVEEDVPECVGMTDGS